MSDEAKPYTDEDIAEMQRCDRDPARWKAAVDALKRELVEAKDVANAPVPMHLHCPKCHELHIDEGEFTTKPHHTHSCQACGLTWRPAVAATVGVRFLPGFKNEDIALDWSRILPHHMRASCAECNSDTNSPAVYGYTFSDGKWHCYKHSAPMDVHGEPWGVFDIRRNEWLGERDVLYAVAEESKATQTASMQSSLKNRPFEARRMPRLPSAAPQHCGGEDCAAPLCSCQCTACCRAPSRAIPPAASIAEGMTPELAAVLYPEPPATPQVEAKVGPLKLHVIVDKDPIEFLAYTTEALAMQHKNGCNDGRGDPDATIAVYVLESAASESLRIACHLAHDVKSALSAEGEMVLLDALSRVAEEAFEVTSAPPALQQALGRLRDVLADTAKEALGIDPETDQSPT